MFKGAKPQAVNKLPNGDDKPLIADSRKLKAESQ
jgi:hypothetical protein